MKSSFALRFNAFLVVGLAGVTVLGATGCPGPIDEDAGPEPDPVIAFTTPRDGFILNNADDKDGDPTNGVQYDVRVRYSGDEETELTLTSDQGSTATASTTAGFATFVDFTISSSEAGVTNVLTATDGDVDESITVTGRVSAANPIVCSFLTPTDNAVITADANTAQAGVQFTARVVCAGDGVSPGQTLTLNAGDADVVRTLDANREATGLVTAGEDDGANTVSATLTNADGDTLDEVSINVTVDLAGGASCTITSPANGATLTDDADGSANGFQIDVDVSCSGQGVFAGQTVTVNAGGASVSTSLIGSGPFTASLLANAGTANGVNTITASLPGGLATTNISVTVQSDLPLCDATITSPTTGASFDASAVDADLNTPEFDIAVDVTAAPTTGGTCDGATARVSDGTNDFQALISGTTATVIVTLADGSYTLTAEVENVNGIGDSDSVDVSVDRTGPSIVVTSPEDGEVYGPADDLDANIANGISLTFEGTVTNATSADWNLDCGGNVTSGALTLDVDGNFSQALADLPLGNCTLDVDATDGVNAATFTATFTLAGVSVDVVLGGGLDLAPLGYFIASEDGNAGTPADMDVEVAVTATFDTGTYTATYDVVRISDGAVLVDDADLGALTSGVAATGTITVPYGELAEYDVIVSIVPSAGLTVVATETFFVDTVAPTLNFTAPTAGFAYRANDDQSANVGFQAFMQVATTGFVGGIVSVSIAGPSTVNAQCTANGVGNCTLTPTLPDGAWTATASATDAAGNVATPAVRSFSVDATLPAVGTFVVVDDTENGVGAATPDGRINRAENGGVGGPATSNVVVTFAAAAGIEDGRQVTLTATPGANYNANAAGNVVTFNNVVLAEGTTTLTVNGTDLVGNPIDLAGKTRTITVDTVVPTIAIVSPTGTVIAGASANIAVSSNAENAQLVTLEDVTAAAQLLDAQPLAAGSVLFNGVALQQGNRTLRASVRDLAGNPAQADRTYNVDAQAPQLVLTLVSDAGVDADLAAPGWQVDFSVSYTGLEIGRSIALVSSITGQRGTATAPTDDSGSVAIRGTFANSAMHGMSARATDAAGNLGVSNTITVDIVTGLYDVFVDSPVAQGSDLYFGAADVTVGVASLVVTVPTLLGGSTVELLRDGLAVAGATVFNTGDVYTITWTVVEGATGTLEVTVDDGVKTGTSGVYGYLVDAVAPTVTWPGAAPTSYGIASDLAAGLPGLQANVTVDVTECESGTLEILEGALVLGTATVSAAGSGSIVVAIEDTVEHTGVAWTARCTDIGSNVGTDDLVTTVDLTAPNAPGVTLTTLDPKRGIVGIDVVAPGSDGATGANVQLDVVASRGALSLATFDAAALTPVFPGRGGLVAQSSATAAGATFATQATGLAFDTSWTVTVRATDAVGNTSLGADTVSDLGLPVVTLAHTDDGIGCDDRFPRGLTSTADFNGDGIADLVLAAPSTGDLQGFGCFGNIGDGTIELWHGRADLSTIDKNTPSRTLDGAAVSYGFGRRLGVADLDNDGRSDLIAYAEDQNFPYQMFIAIHYGVNTSTLGVPDLVELAPRRVLLGGGDPNYDYYADTMRGIGDVNGDGFEDLWIGPIQLLAGEQMRGRIIFGSATRIADGTNYTALPHAILTSTLGGVVAIGVAAALGNLDGDAFDDFAVRQQGGNIVVVRGRATWPTPPATFDLASTPAADRLVCPGDQCGIEMTTGDINGDGLLDLVATQPVPNGVAVYLNNGANGLATSQSYLLQSPGGIIAGLSRHLAAGDLNDDGFDDVVFASSNQGGEPTAMRIFFGGAYASGNGIVAGVRGTADLTYAVTHSAVEPATAASCGDLDNDGTDDLCFGTELNDGAFYVRY